MRLDIHGSGTFPLFIHFLLNTGCTSGYYCFEFHSFTFIIFRFNEIDRNSFVHSSLVYLLYTYVHFIFI